MGLLWAWSEQHLDASDALDLLSVQGGAEFACHVSAAVSVDSGQANLDELVVVKGSVRLGQNSLRYARLADAYHGLQSVGKGAQASPLERGERHRRMLARRLTAVSGIEA